MESVEGIVEGGGHGHHPLLLRTRRADPPSHGEGGWTSRRWGSFIINSLLVGSLGGLVVENVEGLVEGGGHAHHPLLLRTRRAGPPSHREGGWTSRGWGSFMISSLLMGRFGRLVMENVEGLVEGGGHGHHPLLLRIRRADPWSSPSPS